jgi:hypothetical protein
MPYCTKCGASLQQDASFCQACGNLRGAAPPVRRSSQAPLVVLASLGAIVAISTIAFLIGGTSPSGSSPDSTAVAALAADSVQNSALLDSIRNELRWRLKKARELDVYDSVRRRSSGHIEVVVGPTFYSMPFENKEIFARAIGAYEGAPYWVNFHDRYSGQMVAELTPAGFKMRR